MAQKWTSKADVRKPSVLVISTKRWPISARIALELAKAGFLVAAISPSGSFIDRTRAVRRRYSFRIGARRSSIVRAISDWSPDLLVCADDQSVKELHRLHSQAGIGPKSECSAKLI